MHNHTLQGGLARMKATATEEGEKYWDEAIKNGVEAGRILEALETAARELLNLEARLEEHLSSASERSRGVLLALKAKIGSLWSQIADCHGDLVVFLNRGRRCRQESQS
jgi:hypothetical protein